MIDKILLAAQQENSGAKPAKRFTPVSRRTYMEDRKIRRAVFISAIALLPAMSLVVYVLFMLIKIGTISIIAGAAFAVFSIVALAAIQSLLVLSILDINHVISAIVKKDLL